MGAMIGVLFHHVLVAGSSERTSMTQTDYTRFRHSVSLICVSTASCSEQTVTCDGWLCNWERQMLWQRLKAGWTMALKASRSFGMKRLACLNARTKSLGNLRMQQFLQHFYLFLQVLLFIQLFSQLKTPKYLPWKERKKKTHKPIKTLR